MGMYFLTVLGETRMPNFTKSSLAMRSSPHKGFSVAIRRMSCAVPAEWEAVRVVICSARTVASPLDASAQLSLAERQSRTIASHITARARQGSGGWRHRRVAVLLHAP